MLQRAIAIGVVLSSSAFAVAGETTSSISLHPDNGHYFLWRDRPTILITSGEHYGAVLNLDFDYVRYLDELKSKELNHTRTFSGVYRELPSSFGITDNTLAPKPNRYAAPWLRSDRPGYYDGGNKFDLNRWDPAYFTRLKDYMQNAQDRGIVVEYTLFCPFYRDELWDANPMNQANNINGVGKCDREDVYSLKDAELTKIQLAFVRRVVAELREFDNLYYEVCNEPYFGGVTEQWQRRIADEIVEAEREFPASQRHLISMNIANGQKKVEDPHPAVSIFNFHYCVPPDTVAMNFGLNRVIGENETGFRGKADVLYRTEAWDFLLAGGGLYNNLDYSFTPKHPDGSFRGYESPGGGSAELREQLQILKRFLYGFDFVEMRPDDSVLLDVSPSFTAKALAHRGESYAIYIHVPLPKKPKDLASPFRKYFPCAISLRLPEGRYQARWINPVNGKCEKTQSLQHGGGACRLASPEFDDDIALSVIRQ